MSVSRFVTAADGLRLHYREAAGPPGAPVVLCLPGLTRNSRDFTALAARLAARYRVLCPDQRGRGLSDRDPKWRRYHPTTYVADMWRLLDEADVAHCAIIGTSLGGLMAMQMCGEDRARITGVVLNDVGPEIAPEGLARISRYIGLQPPVASWDEAARQARDAYAIALPDFDHAAWLAYARQSYREDDAGVPELDADPNIGRALREVGSTLDDPWGLFTTMGVPTLVLRGALSDILSAGILAAMEARRPDLETVTVPNRGHVPQLDEPAALTAIERFLASLGDASTDG